MPLVPQPEAVVLLTALLEGDPVPTEIGIAPLSVDGDNGGGGYPARCFSKVGPRLGLNASDLPRLARDFRAYYNPHRPRLRGRAAGDGAPLDGGGRAEGGDGLRSDLLRGVLDATACLLTVCPDHATAWADRRRALVEMGRNGNGGASTAPGSRVERFRAELDFLDLLFTQHSKAPNSWAHRKWLCRRIVESVADAPWGPLLRWAEREMAVCAKVAERFPKNYYAWTHRSYVARAVCEVGSWGDCDADVRSFLSGEVSFSEFWLHRHVSDHSAAHYGSEVLRLLLSQGFVTGDAAKNNRAWALSEAERALANARDLVGKFPSHEVIWIWRRFCGLSFLEVLSGKFNLKGCVELSSVGEISCFVNIEVFELAKELSRKGGAEYLHVCDVDEVKSARVHTMTYILWILEHIKRSGCKGSLDNFVEAEDLGRSLAHDLNDDEKIVYNILQISNRE